MMGSSPGRVKPPPKTRSNSASGDFSGRMGLLGPAKQMVWLATEVPTSIDGNRVWSPSSEARNWSTVGPENVQSVPSMRMGPPVSMPHSVAQ